MHDPITTTQIVTHGGIAVFGAMAHALNAHRNGTSKTKKDFVALMLMSSFCGAIFALLGLHVFEHQLYLSHAIAGTGGWLGVEGMAIITKYIADRFKK